MSECPVKHDTATSSAGGCPVKGDETKPETGYNEKANDFSYNQHRQPGQTKDMSTVRPVSGIPKSTFTPGHQFAGVDRWVYPSGEPASLRDPQYCANLFCTPSSKTFFNDVISEQQYFNAMKKKGYDPAEDDMPVILAIHNIVNEQGWSKVKEWESLRGCQNPKLKQFQGRPKDISPKAYLMSLMG